MHSQSCHGGYIFKRVREQGQREVVCISTLWSRLKEHWLKKKREKKMTSLCIITKLHTCKTASVDKRQEADVQLATPILSVLYGRVVCSLQSFLKQNKKKKSQTFSGFSFSNERICCCCILSVSYKTFKMPCKVLGNFHPLFLHIKKQIGINRENTSHINYNKEKASFKRPG